MHNSPETLVTAYRDGLGLTAIVLIAGDGGARLMHAADGEAVTLAASQTIRARWWCKKAQAEWLVAAIETAQKRRRTDCNDAARLIRAVPATAKRLGIALRSDEEIAAEADAVIARLDAEIAVQQRSGALKSVNRGYRDYRLQASARGEKVLRYAEWMARYRARLVRDIAQNMRQF